MSMKQYNWKPVISSLVRQLIKDGFVPFKVDDGGDELESTPSAKSAVDAMNAVDESYLLVKKNGKRFGLLIILGNSPEETVADHSCDPELEESVNTFSHRWAGKPCPMVEI